MAAFQRLGALRPLAAGGAAGLFHGHRAMCMEQEQLEPGRGGPAELATSPIWRSLPDHERDALQRLRRALQPMSRGTRALVQKFGGPDADRCLLCYLRAGDVLYDVDLAAQRMERTVAFRAREALDGIGDVHEVVERHPMYRFWPASYPGFATDGCPFHYIRVGALDGSRLGGDAEEEGCEDSLERFFVLWLELALARQRECVAGGFSPDGLCKGTYDVYNCGEMRLAPFLDVAMMRKLRSAAEVGQAHYPENLYKCFVVNAPTVVAVVWRLVRPFLHEKTQGKVSITRGVPEELEALAGGHAALEALLESVPAAMR